MIVLPIPHSILLPFSFTVFLTSTLHRILFKDFSHSYIVVNKLSVRKLFQWLNTLIIFHSYFLHFTATSRIMRLNIFTELCGRINLHKWFTPDTALTYYAMSFSICFKSNFNLVEQNVTHRHIRCISLTVCLDKILTSELFEIVRAISEGLLHLSYSTL